MGVRTGFIWRRIESWLGSYERVMRLTVSYMRGMYRLVEQTWTSQGNYCMELLLQCGLCVQFF